MNINEDDLIAEVRAQHARLLPLFPEARELFVSVGYRNTDSTLDYAITVWAYLDDKFNSEHGYGKSFDSAALSLRDKIEARKPTAQSLREQAAQLLAQAEAIES